MMLRRGQESIKPSERKQRGGENKHKGKYMHKKKRGRKVNKRIYEMA